MRIGIVTITDGANYGNRLQNYALSKVIKSLGHDVYTFRRKTFRDVLSLKKIIKIAVKQIVGKENKFYKRRVKIFNQFTDYYIPQAEECLSFNNAPQNINESYDYFVVGSDQVWNTRIKIIQDDINNYLLSFAPSEKRVAYAASFGSDTIPNDYSSFFADNLIKFKAISVRELPGVNIIKKLINEEVECLVDPTLLVSKQDWTLIEKKPDYITNKKYICTYFLGKQSKQTRDYITSKAKVNNLEIVNLENEFICTNNKKQYLTSPEEFVWLIHHAEIFMTDSFHGSVFSIIFGTPFFVTKRESVEHNNNMYGRIETLLTKFDANDAFISDNCVICKEPFKPDESFVSSVLQIEKDKAFLFLKKNLT